MAASTKTFTHAGAHVLTEADGTDAAAPPPSEPEGFPLHAMRMKDFLALEKLRPHNALKKEGLVVALDFDGAHRDAKLNFVSHQWLAYAEADPNGDHLKTMQDVFRRVLAGESIFRSEDDWSAYTKGACEENARWSALAHASRARLSATRKRRASSSLSGGGGSAARRAASSWAVVARSAGIASA